MTDRETMKLALEALEFAAAQIYNEDNDDIIAGAADALRKALDHVPDTTKMIEPDMGIDRGAWADVPDATRWVDELRGDDEQTEHEPVAWMSDSPTKGNGKQLHWTKAEAWRWSSNITPLYTAPPKREWVGLTDEEKWSIFTSKDWTGKPLSLIDAVLTAYEEKNRD